MISSMTTKVKLITAIRSALIEFFSHGFFILLAYLIYTNLPYYINLLNPVGENILNLVLISYIFLGSIYFLGKHLFFTQDYRQNKSYIVLTFMANSLPKIKNLFLSIPQDKHFMDLPYGLTVRTALLSILVKFFFLPLMISFFIGQFSTVANLFTNIPHANFFSLNTFNSWTYYVIYNSIFVVDTATFTIGYAFEAKWLDNQIKSVDPHLSGWLVALICYPPFNTAIGTFYQTSFPHPILFPILQNFWIALCMKIATLLLYLIYVWGSVALFTKASNLTNRGIISRGPYKYIRHPAYATKNIAWWLEQLPYYNSWIPMAALFLWNIVYILRALTEERHLLQDPDYKAYAQKVRYRFIPFVI